MLLLAVPAASSLVARPAFRPIQPFRNTVPVPSTAQYARSHTALPLGLDPASAVDHVDGLSQAHPALDALLSTMFTTTAGLSKSVLPNTSLPPLPETIQSGIVTSPDLPGSQIIIPDMPAMPGGVPKSGNPFLADLFRQIFHGPVPTPRGASFEWSSAPPNAEIVVPARELDLTARYADLLSRVPMVAALYACVDFFVLNAEEDFAIVELLDEEEAGDVMGVEGAVFGRRLVGLMVVVIGTVLWSDLTYHPVPFGQL
ncbi:hypothetical protein ACHAXS_013058 [Conticribra weissflogii]